ncbi:MAG: Type II secretory pathway, pullulanase PulA, partial [Rhodobacterales bacterium]
HLGHALGAISHVNRSNRAKDWRGFYSDADAELVAKACAPDIRRFSYRFDPGD